MGIHRIKIARRARIVLLTADGWSVNAFMRETEPAKLSMELAKEVPRSRRRRASQRQDEEAR
jgi:hypothetical protein